VRRTCDSGSDAIQSQGKKHGLEVDPDAGYAFENPSDNTGCKLADAQDPQTPLTAKTDHPFLFDQLHPAQR
jgi:hypothetical protein